MQARLVGKSVFVTGANRGLGQALVEESLRRGAKRVYAGARRHFSHPDPRVTPVILDVTDPAQIPGPIDTDMVRALDIPKTPPEDVARAALDGVERGEDDIFPDPMSAAVAESWQTSPVKEMERQNAALVAEPIAA